MPILKQVIGQVMNKLVDCKKLSLIKKLIWNFAENGFFASKKLQQAIV